MKMINFALVKLLWKIQRHFVIFSFIFIGFLQFLIIWIFSSLDYVPIFEAFYKQLPSQVKVLLDEQFMYRLSVKGAVAFGMNHPLVLVIMGILAIEYSTRLISGEAEKGLLELILSHPLERNRFFSTLFLATGFFLLIAISGALSGSFAALLLKRLATTEIFVNLIKIGINLWFLFMLIAGYSLLFATYSKERGKFGTAAIVITLIFYFLHFIGSFWDELSFLKPFNFFSYYLPQKLMFGEIQLYQNLLPLAGLILLFFILGIKRFSLRDIP
jgi:ABC-type transport system involved in multi-copper enzyme maturation permease subunit